jgi:hypothetical protein
MLRELPCTHIFHAACVDPFLTTHSSLCPLCKKSALPTGYVPKTITNVMVRRERQVRRLRGAGLTSNGSSRDVVRLAILGQNRTDSTAPMTLSERLVERLDAWREARERRESEYFNGRTFRAPLGRLGGVGFAPAGNNPPNEMAEMPPQQQRSQTNHSPLMSPTAAQVVPATLPSPPPPVLGGEETVHHGPSAIPGPALGISGAEDEAGPSSASRAEASRGKSWWNAVSSKVFPRA